MLKAVVSGALLGFVVIVVLIVLSLVVTVLLFGTNVLYLATGVPPPGFSTVALETLSGVMWAVLVAVIGVVLVLAIHTRRR